MWGSVSMPPQTAVSYAGGKSVIRTTLGLAEGMVETRGSGQGTLALATKTANAQPGGAWNISAEAPGHSSARTLSPAM